jgi:hypothetical protein
MSNIDHRLSDGAWQLSLITVMPSAASIQSRYTAEELMELRRNTLRYARSFPPGDERNRHRQIAALLRTLFQSDGWFKAHTFDGPLVP